MINIVQEGATPGARGGRKMSSNGVVVWRPCAHPCFNSFSFFSSVYEPMVNSITKLPWPGGATCLIWQARLRLGVDPRVSQLGQQRGARSLELLIRAVVGDIGVQHTLRKTSDAAHLPS